MMIATKRRFFISYSSRDRRAAEIIASRLRERGALVWIDYEQIKLGEPILTRIAEGLSNCDVLLLLVSHSSGQSPWCRKEYEVLLRREILSNRHTVIPVRLDDSTLPILLEDKRYLRFEDLDECLAELLTGVGSRPGPASAADSLPSGLIDGLSFLLLLDQFPIGVWGRSLTPLGFAYGHAEDPGSITVSDWCADALRALQPTGEVPEIDVFTTYLLNRRSSESGAVGMRKQVGSTPFSEYVILENRRHTAVAALYLQKHCNALDLALQSLRYVMASQTPRGAWVAIGKPVDENADALTTGYVLGVLKEFEEAGLLGSVAIDKRDLFLARYWKAGLLWLYENLLANDGWWPYRDSRRIYCYTSDILLAVPGFWMEDPHYEKVHEELVTRLFDIWRKNGVGIPAGPVSDVPNLETTTQYAAAIWRCRARYPDLCTETQKLFLANLESMLDEGESDAAGWALSISHLIRGLGLAGSSKQELSYLRQMAITFKLEKGEKALEGASLPEWTYKAARNRVLTVTADPP